MVVTLTTQLVFMDASRNRHVLDGEEDAWYDAEAGTWCIAPLYYQDRAGRLFPFDRAKASEPEFRNLVLTTNTDTYYVRQAYPFYGMLNLRLSKEIGRVATVSFYANNFLNLRGRVRNSVTHYPNDRNTPLYFGAEVKISIR